MTEHAGIERRYVPTLRRQGGGYTLPRPDCAAREGLASFERAEPSSEQPGGVPQRVALRGAVAGLLGSGIALERFAAARLMRRVLVEQPPSIARPIKDIRSFDHALDRLRQRDPLSADIVELHYFAGQRPAEIAQALAAPVPLVLDKLRFCKAWLAAEIQRQQHAERQPRLRHGHTMPMPRAGRGG